MEIDATAIVGFVDVEDGAGRFGGDTWGLGEDESCGGAGEEFGDGVVEAEFGDEGVGQVGSILRFLVSRMCCLVFSSFDEGTLC